MILRITTNDTGKLTLRVYQGSSCSHRKPIHTHTKTKHTHKQIWEVSNPDLPKKKTMFIAFQTGHQSAWSSTVLFESSSPINLYFAVSLCKFCLYDLWDLQVNIIKRHGFYAGDTIWHNTGMSTLMEVHKLFFISFLQSSFFFHCSKTTKPRHVFHRICSSFMTCCTSEEL